MPHSHILLPSNQISPDQFKESNEGQDRVLADPVPDGSNQGNTSLANRDAGLTLDHDITVRAEINTLWQYLKSFNGVSEINPISEGFFRFIDDPTQTFYSADAYGSFFQHIFSEALFDLDNGFKFRFNNVIINGGDQDENDAYIELSLDDQVSNNMRIVIRFSSTGIKVFNYGNSSQVGTTLTKDLTVEHDFIIAGKIITGNLNVSLYYKELRDTSWATAFTDTNVYMGSGLISGDRISIGISNSEHNHKMFISSFDYRYSDDDGFANGLPAATPVNLSRQIHQSVLDHLIDFGEFENGLYKDFTNNILIKKINNDEIAIFYTLRDLVNERYKLSFLKYNRSADNLQLMKEFFPIRNKTELTSPTDKIILDDNKLIEQLNINSSDEMQIGKVVPMVNGSDIEFGTVVINGSTWGIEYYDQDDFGSPTPKRTLTGSATNIYFDASNYGVREFAYDPVRDYIWVCAVRFSDSNMLLLAYNRTDNGDIAPTVVDSTSFAGITWSTYYKGNGFICYYNDFLYLLLRNSVDTINYIYRYEISTTSIDTVRTYSRSVWGYLNAIFYAGGNSIGVAGFGANNPSQSLFLVNAEFLSQAIIFWEPFDDGVGTYDHKILNGYYNQDEGLIYVINLDQIGPGVTERKLYKLLNNGSEIVIEDFISVEGLSPRNYQYEYITFNNLNNLVLSTDEQEMITTFIDYSLDKDITAEPDFLFFSVGINYILGFLNFNGDNLYLDVIGSGDGGINWNFDFSDDSSRYLVDSFDGLRDVIDSSVHLAPSLLPLIAFTTEEVIARSFKFYPLSELRDDTKHIAYNNLHGKILATTTANKISIVDENNLIEESIDYDPILNPNLVDPYGITFDDTVPNGALYVSCQIGNSARILKYDGLDVGSITPIATTSISLTDIKGISFNDEDLQLITCTRINTTGENRITFFDTNVLFLRQLFGASTRMNINDDVEDIFYVGDVVLGGPPSQDVDKCFVVVNKRTNELLFFADADTISGNTAPQKWIGGGLTLLNGPVSIFVDRLTYELYVLQDNSPELLVFDFPTSNGGNNYAPKATYALDGNLYSGITRNGDQNIVTLNGSDGPDEGLKELNLTLATKDEINLNIRKVVGTDAIGLYQKTIGTSGDNIGGVCIFKQSSASNNAVVIYSQQNGANVELVSHVVNYVAGDWVDSGVDTVELASITDDERQKNYKDTRDNSNNLFYIYSKINDIINLMHATGTADGTWTDDGEIYNQDESGIISHNSIELFNDSIAYLISNNGIGEMIDNSYYLGSLSANAISNQPQNESLRNEGYFNLLKNSLLPKFFHPSGAAIKFTESDGSNWFKQILTSNPYQKILNGIEADLVDNIKVTFNGTSIYPEDKWTMETIFVVVGANPDKGQELVSISPSEIFQTSNDTSVYRIVFDATLAGDSFAKFIFNSFCLINTNFLEANIKADPGPIPNWSSPAFAQNIRAYDPVAYDFTVGTVTGNYIILSIPENRLYEFVGKRIYVRNGTALGDSYIITNCDGYGIYVNEDAQTNGLSSGDDIYIFTDRMFGVTANFPIDTSIQRYRFVCVEIPTQDTSEGYFFAGKFILGLGSELLQMRSVPYEDSYRPNVVLSRSISGKVSPKLQGPTVFRTEIMWNKLRAVAEKEMNTFLEFINHTLYNFAFVFDSGSKTQQELNNFRLMRLSSNFSPTNVLGDSSVYKTNSMTIIEDK